MTIQLQYCAAKFVLQNVHTFLPMIIQISQGEQGFDELIKSIVNDRTQLHLAQKLNQAFEEKHKRLQGKAIGTL